MTKKKQMTLTTKIIIGLIGGFLVGAIFNQMGVGEGLAFKGKAVVFDKGVDPSFIQTWIVGGVIHLGGYIFMACLKLLVVPLVLVSLVCGVASLDDITKLGRVGGKTLALYLFTTCLAISIAIVAALAIKPGLGDVSAAKTAAGAFQAKEAPPLIETIINIFPTNPIASMAEGKMLQIIVFAILFGLAISLSGQAGKRVFAIFTDFNDVIMKLVMLLMAFAPVGVFCLVAKAFTLNGPDLIAKLGWYFVTVLLVLAIHGFLVYPSLLKAFTGLSPIMFAHNMRPPLLFAFSTSSSNATIPVTLEAVEHRMGVKNSIAAFTIPLGATINMDGTAIMQGVATVFIAQAFGYTLGFNDYIMVVITATLASIGTAGVPGVGLIMLAMVLNQVGINPEHIGVIIGVDRLLDMCRTAVNVSGDCAVTCIVAHGEKALDKKVFYSKQT